MIFQATGEESIFFKCGRSHLLVLHTAWSVCTRILTPNKSQSRPSRASPLHTGRQAVISGSRSSLRVILSYVTCWSSRCVCGTTKHRLIVRMGRKFSMTYLSTSNLANAWVLVSGYTRILGDDSRLAEQSVAREAARYTFSA